jgi:hypothetical protein
MSFFAPDLFRDFALGFAASALLVAGLSAPKWSEDVAPAAFAAEPPAAPLSAPEFRIGDAPGGHD